LVRISTKKTTDLTNLLQHLTSEVGTQALMKLRILYLTTATRVSFLNKRKLFLEIKQKHLSQPLQVTLPSI